MAKSMPILEALIAATAAPAIAFGLLSWSVAYIPFAFAIAAVHSIPLGLPLVLFLRSRGWINAVTSIGGGFVIGALPIAVMACPLWFPSWVFSFEQAIVGRTPAAGEWLLYAEQVLFFGSLGALAGLVFWSYLRLRKRPDGGVQPTPG